MRAERERDGGLYAAPLPELLRELLREGQGLIREEVRLARTELGVEASRAKRWSGLLTAGGALAHAALLLLGGTLVLVGTTFVRPWLSALVVTGLYAVAAGVLLALGKRELGRARPSRAVETIKEDGRWARETMRDIRSRRRAHA